jgi:uncharacterized tellurite resistance protein B-like protein
MSSIVSRSSRPVYLANVLHIAKVDGVVSRAESWVLRSIINRIGAGNDDLAAARALLTDGPYTPQLPGSLNERMDNLQDMIMVALADGEAIPQESKPIEQMAKMMRYSQAGVDLAVRRAQVALGISLCQLLFSG